MEVCCCVSALKDTKHTGVQYRVGLCHIAELEGDFDCVGTPISPNFDPDLRLWDEAIVSSQSVIATCVYIHEHVSIIIMYNVKSIVTRVLSMQYLVKVILNSL